MAKQVLIEEVKDLKNQLAKKADKGKTDKGKGKLVQFATLPSARIDNDIITPILDRVETIDQFRKRTFIAPKSNKMIVVPPSIPEDTEMVSSGDEESYQNMTIEEEEALYFLDDAYNDNPG